jgi:type IV pilus assembly protein PilM
MKSNKIFRRLLNGYANIVGLDIGVGFIKAAEISFAAEKPCLKSAGIISVPDAFRKEKKIGNFQALPELLQKLWAENKLTCRDVSTAIDGREVFVREIAFPAMSGEELKSAVRWDMGNYVPYPENSYYYDFAATNMINEGAKESRVLLAAAPMASVDNIAGMLKEAAFKVWAVDIEPLAMKETMGIFDAVNVIVDIGYFHSQIILFSGEVPSVTMIVPWGGQKFTQVIMEEFGINFAEAEILKMCQDESFLEQKSEDFRQYRLVEIHNLVDELAAAIRQAVEYYFSKNEPKNIEKVYLTGGGANFKNLAKNIENRLEQVPVRVHNPFIVLDIAPDLDKDYLNGIAPQFAVAVGLALRCGKYDASD